MDEITLRKLMSGVSADELKRENQPKSPELEAARQEVENLDKTIKKALDVSLPSDFEARLLAIPDDESIVKPSVPKNQKPIIYSLAASVVLAVLVLLLQPRHDQNFAVSAFDHASHVHPLSSPISYNTVNQQLEAFGAKLEGNIGQVVFVKPCRLKNQSIMHLILQVNDAPVSVYLLPEQSNELLSASQDGKLIGLPMQNQSRQVYLVGEDQANLQQAKQKLKEKLSFQI